MVKYTEKPVPKSPHLPRSPKLDIKIAASKSHEKLNGGKDKMGKSFTSGAGGMMNTTHTINFNKMTSRKLEPIPRSFDNTRNTESEWFRDVDIGRETGAFKKHGIQFSKQTNRKDLFGVNQPKTTGLEYNTTLKNIGSSLKGTLSFDKILPREQFQNIKSIHGRNNGYQYRRNLYDVKNSTNLDFKTMTGRDILPITREGLSPLEVIIS